MGEKMKVLVTGATGFIGGSIVEDLVKEGHEVFALVRKTSLIDHLVSLGVKFVFGDITDKDSLYAITGKFDAIFHCAAYVDDKNREKLKLVNIKGTESVCKLALRLSAGRLIYLSSVAVVSGHFQVPLTEDLSYSATNLYGESKIEAERIVWDFRRKGLPSAILRPPMVYGENEPHLLKIILFLIKHRLFPIVGGGKNKLHLGYVKNISQAAIMALHNENFLKGAYFVADKEILSTGEIYSILAQTIKAAKPVIIPAGLSVFLSKTPWLGRKIDLFLKDRVYDISRIEMLGYKPRVKAQEALIRSARYFYPAKDKF
jgi:nucleoside-diphosphate-sugar epimerase